MDDPELIRRLVQGDERAWESLVRQHRGLLEAAAAKVLGRGSEAEDAVQAVLARLWEDDRRRIRAFQGRCRLSTWLVTITVREAIERVRARKRRDALDAAAPAANGADDGPSRRVEDVETRAAIEAAMGGLPPRERLLVRLVHLDGFSHEETARLLGVPTNSVSPWLFRARGHLKELLARTSSYGPGHGNPPSLRSED